MTGSGPGESSDDPDRFDDAADADGESDQSVDIDPSLVDTDSTDDPADLGLDGDPSGSSGADDRRDESSADDDRNPSTDENRTDSSSTDEDPSETDHVDGEDDGDDSAAVESGAVNEAAERDEAADERPPNVTIEDDGIVRWFLKTNDGTVVFVRDLVTSVAVVAIIALILFAVSGVWPPLVAVESGSMEPNMHRGDMIFVVDEQRFTGDDPIEGTGVVTYEVGEENDHSTFGKSGDVIIFQPNGDEYRTPVIHRAHFWVEEGENWVDDRSNDPRIMDQSCESVKSCPAPHPGFVTIGDNNDGYDQIGPPGADTTVVKPEWIEGKAKYRIPWLGYVRLTFDELLTVQPAALWVTGSAALGSVALVGGHRRLH